MDRSRTPVVVGVGQLTLRDQAWPDVLEPLDMMAEAVTIAAKDTGALVLDSVDHLMVSPVFGWEYRNAPLLLAERLGIDPGCAGLLKVGGNTPQEGVTDAAELLQRGEIEMAVVTGGEAIAAKKAIQAAGHEVQWAVADEPYRAEEEPQLIHLFELMRQAVLPIVNYPLFEPALRVAGGRTPEEHVEHIGRIMSRFTEVASRNPYAWFRDVRTADELMTVTVDNRMVSTPYPMAVNSFMGVDQAAAVVVTTEGRARRLGIPEDRWVYVLAGADCDDIFYFTERAAYDHSPAMRTCASSLQVLSGVGIDDVGFFDVYSCFPSAVQLAAEALGVDPVGDPRDLTVTGGLPYAGGPWNNYVTHAIAGMVDTLRANPGEAGIVSGNGGFVTKHGYGMYASRPPERPFARNDRAADQARIDVAPHPRLEEEPSGRGTIEGYTVQYRRDGEPDRVLALARLDEERRTLLTTWDPDVTAAFVEGEWLGRSVEVGENFTLTVAG